VNYNDDTVVVVPLFTAAPSYVACSVRGEDGCAGRSVVCTVCVCVTTTSVQFSISVY